MNDRGRRKLSSVCLNAQKAKATDSLPYGYRAPAYFHEVFTFNKGDNHHRCDPFPYTPMDVAQIGATVARALFSPLLPSSQLSSTYVSTPGKSLYIDVQTPTPGLPISIRRFMDSKLSFRPANLRPLPPQGTSAVWPFACPAYPRRVSEPGACRSPTGSLFSLASILISKSICSVYGGILSRRIHQCAGLMIVALFPLVQDIVQT